MVVDTAMDFSIMIAFSFARSLARSFFFCILLNARRFPPSRVRWIASWSAASKSRASISRASSSTSSSTCEEMQRENGRVSVAVGDVKILFRVRVRRVYDFVFLWR